MAVTVEERLLEALKMLEETRDYLKRLPPVPVTYEQIHRIDSFLAQPDNALLEQRKVPRRGAFRAPAGYAIVSAELRGDTLSLWQSQPYENSPIVLSGLKAGERVEIELSLDGHAD